MIYGVASNVLGALVFTFLYWRRMKEDYVAHQVFSSVFIILFSILVPNLISHQTWWFWLASLGLFSGVIIAKYRFRFKFFETFEVGFVATLPWLIFIFLADTTRSASIISLFAVLILVLAVVFYNVINRRYKNFGWYKSGRIGFAGLTTLGSLMLIRGVVAIFYPYVLSFVGNLEVVLCGLVALVAFLGVYDLSRKV